MIFRKTKAAFFILFFFTFSCTKKVEIPENIIPENQMVNIMADAYQLEASLEVLNQDNELSTNLFNEKYLVS